MKKTMLSYLVILVCLISLLIALSTGASKASDVKPLVLRATTMTSSTGTQSAYLQKAVNEIEKLTEGRIKVEIYWKESLVKVKEGPRAIQKGLCDIAWTGGAYHPAEFPLWTHARTILYHPNGEDAGYVARKTWALFDKSKELRADYEKLGVTPWLLNAYDSYVLFSKKIAKTLADMQGMRIRCTGEEAAKCLKAIGAHPTFLPSSETYTALEKGIVDGGLAGWEWGKRYALYEVVPYVVDVRINIAHAFYIVSMSKLAKMSDKDRKTFMEVGRRVSLEMGDALKIEREDYKKFMQAKGTKILPFSDEERQKWANLPAVRALPKEWIERQNAAGRPGTAVMRDFLTVFEVPQWIPAGF